MRKAFSSFSSVQILAKKFIIRQIDMGKVADIDESSTEAVSALRARLYRYCAARERAASEVALQAHKIGLPEAELNEVLKRLKAERLLDEDRHAHVYVRSKFSRGWGRVKIQAGLRALKVPQGYISAALRDEINEAAYAAALQKQLKKKLGSKKPDKTAAARAYRSLMQQGYESALVLAALKQEVEG